MKVFVLSLLDKIMNDIDKLNHENREEVLRKIKEKYMMNDTIQLNESYSLWDNAEDDIYNES